MQKLPERYRVWAAFASLCAMWGSSYLFIRIAVHDISPLSTVALRLGIGACAIFAIAAALRVDLRISPRLFVTIAAAGTINSTVPFLLISWGETTVPSGIASVLNSTTPIFTLILAGVLLHDEPITARKLGGVTLGFLGVVVLLLADLTGSLSLSSLAGKGAIITAAAAYAVGAVFVRRTLRGVPSMTIACYVLLASALEVLALSLVFSPPPVRSMSLHVWFAVAWLGVLGSAFAFMCAYYVLQHWGASRYTLVTYVLPVLGLLLGAVFLHEVVDWHIVAGTVLILSGIVLASLRKPVGAAEEPQQIGGTAGGQAPQVGK